MKEKDPRENEIELTNTNSQPRLEGEETIFMADEGNQEKPQNQPEQEPKDQAKTESDSPAKDTSSSRSQSTAPSGGSAPPPKDDDKKKAIVTELGKIGEGVSEISTTTKSIAERFDQAVQTGERNAQPDLEEFMKLVDEASKASEAKDIAEGRGRGLKKQKMDVEKINELFNKAPDVDVAYGIYVNKFRRHVRVVYSGLEREEKTLTESGGGLDPKRKELKNKLKDVLDKKREDFQSTEDIKNAVNDLTENIKIQDHIYFEGETDPYNPKGLEDLVQVILTSESDVWQIGGKRELMNSEGEVMTHNVLAWVRSKINYNHDFNPDGSINLFNEIYVSAPPYKQFSLLEIITTPRYFRKVNHMIVSEEESEAGAPKNAVEYHEDATYDALKEQILMETWLFQNSHNYDASYRPNMGSEEKALETLTEIHYNNIFTRDRNRLFKILTLPSLDREQVDGVLGKNDLEGSVGKGIRKLLLSYYYLGEVGASGIQLDDGKNMFEEALGGSRGVDAFYHNIMNNILSGEIKDAFKDLTFKNENGEDVNLVQYAKDNKKDLLDTLVNHAEFKSLITHSSLSEPEDRMKMDEDLQRAIDNYKATLVDGFSDEKKKAEVTKELAKWILAKSTLIPATFVSEYKAKDFNERYKKNIKDGLVDEKKSGLEVSLSALNVYGAMNREEKIFKLVRSSLRKTVADAENLDEIDGEYAENWAFSMTYWTGISARNDLDSQGFDSWSKLQSTMDYRIKQTKGRGTYGDLPTIFGFKKVGLNFWEALKVREDGQGEFNKSLIDVIQGGDGKDIDYDAKIKGFDFAGRAQTQFVVNHLASAYKLYNYLQKEHGIDFEKFLHYDDTGRVIIDPKARDEISEGIWKALRYGYDMLDFLYHEDSRGWTKNEAGTLVFKTQSLEERMFNEEVLKMGMYEREIEVDGIDKETGKKIKKKEGVFKDSYRSVPKGENGETKEVLKHRSRDMLAYLVAKDLMIHRKWSTNELRYSYEMVELIESFFRNMPLEVKEGDSHEGVLTRSLFNRDEWKKIARTGHATYGGIFLENVAFTGGDMLAEGGLVGLKTFIQTLFK